MSDELDQICGIVREVGSLEALDPDQDFYDAGFSSVRSLDLLLNLEDRFGVSIPDDRFITMRSARGLHDLIGQLRAISPA
jgi:acyl carrier protein